MSTERVAVVTGAGRGFGREVARRLAGRDYAVLATDIDEQGARTTADELGGPAWSMQHDVRDPEAHRAVSAAAGERGRLEVWVNNAGVLRTQKAWEHPDEDVRMVVEANLLGVIWGCRAAVDAMSAQNGATPHNGAQGTRRHIINLASMSSFGPVPGLAVYGASKHGVLGFTESLQGDLDLAGIPIRLHAVCPWSADTGMVRERDEPEAAMVWSGGGLISPELVADRIVELLDSKRMVLTIPRYRGWMARLTGIAPRASLKLAGPLEKIGDRARKRG
jgi:NAD(P)-dependent dehydrogenase (short-subunit alcohol dehydrogenase family)